MQNVNICVEPRQNPAFALVAVAHVILVFEFDMPQEWVQVDNHLVEIGSIAT